MTADAWWWVERREGVVLGFTQRAPGSPDGPYRGLNLALHVGDEPERVERDRGLVIREVATLAGVGPATASAAIAAVAPETYPFFDELVAAQVPTLGKVAWTLGYYGKYADGLRTRASALGDGWTPVMVERALWANVGGKAGA